jgi:hypothetical protein
MQDYQANSNKSKEEPKQPEKKAKKLEKVVSGDVVLKNKTLGSRFKNIFFGGDVNTAASYVVAEVLLPALRNLVVETISKGADRLIYGESGVRRRPVNYGSRVQYNNPIYRGGDRPRAYLPDQRPVDRWTADRPTVEDIIVVSREDAEVVVERMIDIVSQYEVVSLADLYELLGLPSSHVDNKWGWTHLPNTRIDQVRQGWKIAFPPLEEIQ